LHACRKFVADGIMFESPAGDPKLRSAGMAAHWPQGRGVYVSADRGCMVQV
jgi:hypothetical protein